MTSDLGNHSIGIDLGTTNCCMAICRNGKVQIIEDAMRSERGLIPSYVTIDGDCISFGDSSKDTAHLNLERTIFDVKRLIGRKFADAHVQEDKKLWPFSVVDENSLPKIKVDEKTYFPEEISAMLLKYLKDSAEEFLGFEVNQVVITVPAYFNDGQRQATRDAGKLAGFEVLQILNEPSAAAIAYDLQSNSDPSTLRNCLIFDLGGGTFDVSVLTLHHNNIQVKSVGGDTHLGGEDFDNSMIKYCLEEFKKLHNIDLNALRESLDEGERTKAIKAIRRLKTECQKQKEFLSASTAKRVKVNIDTFHSSKDLQVPFDRALFERLNENYFKRCIEIVGKIVNESGIPDRHISDIVLVGGSSRIPKLQKMLTEHFNGEHLKKNINPDQAVAYGAAIQAFLIRTQKEVVEQNLDTDARLRGYGYTLADDKELVNLDKVSVTDVVPISIGVELDRKMDDNTNFNVIIAKNIPFPCSRTKEYSVDKNKTLVKINVYEGEERRTESNHFLGSFEIKLPKSSQGEVLEVTMKIDRNGILSVEANLPRLNLGHQIQIVERKGRLSPTQMRNLLLKVRK